MTTETVQIRAKDKFVWNSGITNFGTVLIKITRVSSTGRFVVATCHRPGGATWPRRFDLPLWPSITPYNWTETERRNGTES